MPTNPLAHSDLAATGLPDYSDDGPAILLAMYMALAAGLEIESQERARELADDARVYIGAGCSSEEARAAMQQTWHRGDN